MQSEFITTTLNNEKIENYAFSHTEFYSCAGYYKHAAGHSVIRKQQKFYLLMLCVDGCGTLCSGGNTYAIQKGDCMLCHAGGPIAYTSSREQPWSLYWVHFELTRESPVFPFLYSKEINPQRVVVNVHNKMPLIDLFEKIINFDDALSDDLQFCLQQSVFLTLLYTGLSAFKMSKGTNQYISAAVKYIDNNINQKITLDELAEEVHLSKYYLSHLFQQIMDISPNRYIIERRIRYAKTLLISSSLTIAEIAREAGFDNAMYFSNIFKRRVGMTPKNYRSAFK